MACLNIFVFTVFDCFGWWVYFAGGPKVVAANPLGSMRMLQFGYWTRNSSRLALRLHMYWTMPHLLLVQ